MSEKAQSRMAEGSELKGERKRQIQFVSENLDVREKAVGFAVNVINTVERVSTDRKHYRLLEQINENDIRCPDLYLN